MLSHIHVHRPSGWMYAVGQCQLWSWRIFNWAIKNWKLTHKNVSQMIMVPGTKSNNGLFIFGKHALVIQYDGSQTETYTIHLI